MIGKKKMGLLKKNAGDNSTWNTEVETLVLQYETPLLRYATSILNNAHAAQDVVQNTFIKLCKQWRKGARPSRTIKGWLYRVTHNEAIDYLRRETRLRALHKKQAKEKTHDCPDGVHCPAEEKDAYENVLRHIRALAQREQQVVLLRLQEGLSYGEISSITGRTKGNVGCILHHAVKKLSKRIQKEQGSVRS